MLDAELTVGSLRLRVYKGLGFEPVLGKDGEVAKVLVRKDLQNDGQS